MRQLLGGTDALKRRAVGDSGRVMFGGYFGSWSRTDADPGIPVAGVRGQTDGMALGLERQVGNGARFGLAFDWGKSTCRVTDPAYPEALNVDLAQIGLYGAVPAGKLTLSVAAAFGFGRVPTSIATPDGPATPSRRTSSFSIAGQAGYRLIRSGAASFELVAGVRHTAAKLHDFTEFGATPPLAGLDRTVSRTRVFAGVDAKGIIHLGGLEVQPHASAHYAHDSGRPAGFADVTFASAQGGPALSAFGPRVGRDVAELGAGLDLRVLKRASVGLGYDAVLRRNQSTHAAKALLSIAL